MIRSRTAGTAAYWLLPPLFCLLIHWAGFTAWFRADDFAWLSLDNGVHNFHDVLSALFSPQAQGTIRPWSDRGFFMVGYALFGLNSLPYRIVIFATAFADLALVASIGTRLTGRRAAGFWAALLWTVNTSSVQPLAWVCVYNEVLCAFCLLLAFHFLLRHVETGARRYYVYQWIVFVLGFGVLETNLVYPAIAVAYALLCARRYLAKTLAMVPVSAAYVAIHSAVAPVAKTGVYGMHFDFSVFKTLAIYWTWSLGPAYLSTPLPVRRWMMIAMIALITLGLAVLVVRQVRAGKPAALFCLLWFPLVLAPQLPLRDHLTEYYPFLPIIGLCWLGGWGMASAWRWATPLALLYGLLVIPHTVAACRWNRDLTVVSHNLVEGLARAHALHPDQALLLDGVDDGLFWNAIYPRASRLAGVDHVYLAPGTDRQIENNSDWGDVSSFVLSGAVTARGLDNDRLEVYDVRGPRLRNVTSQYAAKSWDRDLPLTVDPGNPLDGFLLGPEWYTVDDNFRWMPKRASLRIHGPMRRGQQLLLKGYCADGELAGGPIGVTVSIDGVALPPARIDSQPFAVALPIPDSAVGKAEIQVAIEVSRTFRPPPEERDLGLAFGEIAVR